MSDKTKALHKLEERVYATGKLHAGQAPQILTHVLFEGLRGEVADGRTFFSIPKRTARELVNEKMSAVEDGTFRKAMKTVEEALASCTRTDHSLLDLSDQSGAACDEATIDGMRQLVIVRGPQDREHPSMLKLEVEFRPLSARQPVIPIVASPIGEPRLSIANDDGPLPQEIARDLRDAAQYISAADRMFSENGHAHDFMRRHLNDLVARLKSESQLCARGEIVTEYHDIALLSEWVAKLRDGDEFIGLTDWDRDCEWWDSPHGRQFFLANETAARQKAVVRRIFVYKTPEDRHSRQRRVAEMQRHRSAGINVRELPSSDKLAAAVLPELRSQCVLSARDSNGRLHGWMTYKVAQHDGQVVNAFSINPEVIEGNERMLENIWNSA